MSEQIERELLVDASPQEVWEAITGADWLADEVELDLYPGGSRIDPRQSQRLRIDVDQSDSRRRENCQRGKRP